MTETDIMRLAMLEASKRGHRLWRDNVGLFYTRDGSPIYIGFRGKADCSGLRGTDGKHIAIHFKRSGWRPPQSGDALAHYEDERRFLALVRALHGLAGFATSVEQAMAIIEGSESAEQ